MPNVFNENGLQIETRQEIYDRLSAQMKEIYGDDIDLDPSSPDRQWLELITQDEVDLLELLLQLNASFDPDQAVGNPLIQRVAINGIEPQEGSYTTTDITVFTSRSVNLYGLDQSDETVFMVSDNEGNRWLLVNTVTGLNSPLGTALAFRAEFAGPYTTVPNTITNIDTVVLGVTSVNNPTTYIARGRAQESDQSLKIRRRQSVGMGGRGWIESLIAALQNLSGMISANVFENFTSSIVDGVPAHGIWAITEGTVSDEDIANTIYTYRTGGLDMRGTKTYAIDRPGASSTVISWDECQPVPVPLLLPIIPIDSADGYLFDYDAIATFIVENINLSAGQTVDVTSIGTLLQLVEPKATIGLPRYAWNHLLKGWSFPNNIPNETQRLLFYGFLNTFEVQTFKAVVRANGDAAMVVDAGTFIVSFRGVDSAAIDWNDGSVQTKVRAVPGLGNADVTWYNAVNYEVHLKIEPNFPEGDVGGIITVKSSLTSSGSSVTLVPNTNLSVTWAPKILSQKTVVLKPEIMFPLRLLPASAIIKALPDTEIQFSTIGGYGQKTFYLRSNYIGGTINATTGLYSLGSGTNTYSEVYVRDEYGQADMIRVETP